MDITLGLDFGTHQSKLCMSYMPNNETIYEFIEFDLGNGNKSVFLPSTIQINKDDTIRVGSIDYNDCAVIKIDPPKKPTLPEDPLKDFPPEPPTKLPKEPTRKEDTPLITDPSDWKSSLMSIKNSMKEKDDKKDIDFIIEHKQWEARCKAIQEKHREWENKRDRVLEQWQHDIDKINADYNEEYEIWERHPIEYKVFRYFKQAAFTNTLAWDNQDIPAETLSIWYLTYLLLYARRYVKERFNEIFEESVSVQMGVPSGLNDGTTRMIHFRGQRYLVAARHLMELFDSPEEMCSIPYTELMDMTSYADGDVVREAEEYGFVIIPEAYAGLRSLTYNKRLTRGDMHLLIDIGGGTTDIAFFTIDSSFMPSVHTVTSFHKGLNFILDKYIEDNPECSMGEAQELLLYDTEEFDKAISVYTTELREELGYIIQHVVDEFNKAFDGTHLSSRMLTKAMIGRPIVYCGGGSVFDGIRISNHYFSDKRLINKETLNIPKLINRNLDSASYTILATAYGLSIPSEDEIQTIDVKELWRITLENMDKSLPQSSNGKDYSIDDD